MHQKSLFATLFRQNRSVLFPAAIVSLLALLRLLTILLDGDPIIWPMTDFMRTLAFAVGMAWLVSAIPYNRLKEKCLSAAAFGYVVADVFICILWYVFRIKEEYAFMFLHLLFLAFFYLLYLFRSYEQTSDEIDCKYIYCLRKRPSNLQDFVISLFGCFGSNGAYAIYCNGFVYKFRKGVLTKTIYAEKQYKMYHIQKGVISTDEYMNKLDAMIGIRWHLFGYNCLTLLGKFWRHING